MLAVKEKKQSSSYVVETVKLQSETLKKWQIPQHIIADIELAIEEILTNIVTHGYEQSFNEYNEEIIVDLRRTDDHVEVDIIDKGKFFDLTKKENPQMANYLADNVIGGLGVYMVKNVMCKVECQNNEGTNITKLKKCYIQ